MPVTDAVIKQVEEMAVKDGAMAVKDGAIKGINLKTENDLSMNLTTTKNTICS